MYPYELYLRYTLKYSTSCGERESRPFRAEQKNIHLYFNQHYTCTCSLLLCTQHCRHVRSLWSFRSLQLVEVWPHLEERKKGYVLWL